MSSLILGRFWIIIILYRFSLDIIFGSSTILCSICCHCIVILASSCQDPRTSYNERAWMHVRVQRLVFIYLNADVFAAVTVVVVVVY